MWTPGRAWLEWAVICAAFAILVPSLALLAAGVALSARRRGSPRWLSALLAAAWCGCLGLAMRAMMGVSPLP